MLDIIPLQSGLVNQRISADSEYIIKEVIENRNIVILKQVFDESLVKSVRQRVFTWALEEPASNPLQAFDASYHRIDDNPSQSKTPHIFHAFNFTARDNVRFFKDIDKLFLPMKSLQEQVSGKTLNHQPGATGIAVRPQFIHYPRGGGFFDWHTHPFEPQRVGLILSLSKKHEDFEQGGTSFELDGHTTSIEEHHELGDIALFRYDIPHRVDPIDLHLSRGAGVDFDDIRGKWSFILPFY